MGVGMLFWQIFWIINLEVAPLSAGDPLLKMFILAHRMHILVS